MLYRKLVNLSPVSGAIPYFRIVQDSFTPNGTQGMTRLRYTGVVSIEIDPNVWLQLQLMGLKL